VLLCSYLSLTHEPGKLLKVVTSWKRIERLRQDKRGISSSYYGIHYVPRGINTSHWGVKWRRIKRGWSLDR
jgi:hypothetical protein